MDFKKWFSCQLGSKSLMSLLSARPSSFFDEDSSNGNALDQVTVNSTENRETGSVNSVPAIDGRESDVQSGTQHGGTSITELSRQVYIYNAADPLKRVEALQIKFLRLVNRIEVPTNNTVVAQVLYRLQLGNLIRAGESDRKQPILNINRTRVIAAEQEAAGQPDLDLSFRILLLGKTGVGKSATLNSIFDETKVVTDAFRPATNKIQEIIGTIRGVRVTVIDTPGLLPSYCNQRRNRKILHAVKCFIQRSPPDVVLYFERLDHINRSYSDYPLLRLLTDILGSSMWFNTLLVMTHCSSSPPEGPDGYPIDHEAYTRYCSTIIQHNIQQVVLNQQLEIPVLFVENDPLCKRNSKGEKVLPNGQVWMSQFLLLCAATKVLGEANSLLKFQDSFQLSTANNRVPSLPHLLSSLLRPQSLSATGGTDDEMDKIEDEDDDEDEYDQLPPIRILTKAQYEQLTKDQKESYLDELDYRETLYLKKQWKEDIRRQKQGRVQKSETSTSSDDYESVPCQDVVQPPDMAIPFSFDSDCPAYRYRCELTNDQYLLRPVLDPQGWDHDIGFDGINFEASQDIHKTTRASIVGQMSKDKEDMTVHSECSVKHTNPKGHVLLGGVDVQTASKDLICTLHGDAKFRNLTWNSTGGGVSVTKFGDMYFVGAKFEDSISVGRRFRLTANTGRMAGCGQAAHGGSLEVTIKGKDYPVRDEGVTLAATFLSFEKETIIGGNLQSDFQITRGSKVSASANLNSRRLGKICIRTSTSDHVEIALIAAVSLIRFMFRRRSAVADE